MINLGIIKQSSFWGRSTWQDQRVYLLNMFLATYLIKVFIPCKHKVNLRAAF